MHWHVLTDKLVIPHLHLMSMSGLLPIWVGFFFFLVTFEVCCVQQVGRYLVSSGMLLFKTQLLWRCTESCVLVGGVGAAGLGWLRVVIDLLWRESAVGGGFLAQVHACGGGGGGGRGLKVNWLCGLPGISETTKKGKETHRGLLF